MIQDRQLQKDSGEQLFYGELNISLADSQNMTW